MDKLALRAEMRHQRNQLSITQRQKADSLIEAKVLKTVSGYHTIACYVSFQSEVDTHSLLTKLLVTHRVAVPRVIHQAMEFVVIHPHTTWSKSQNGILEPRDGEVIALSDIDCIITPLLAFDKQGNRLGYGGGYYDRIFQATQAYRLGIAYDMQFIQKVPVESWDIPLHQVITPTSC